MSKKDKAEKKLNKKQAKQAKKAAKAEAAAVVEAAPETDASAKNAVFKITVVRCVAAVLCTAIACAAVSKGTAAIADTIKEMPVSSNVVATGNNNVTSDEPDASPDGSDVTPDAPADGDSTDADTTDADANTGSDNTGSDNTAKPDSPTVSDNKKTQASAENMTKAQIITLFNNAANTAKSSSKSIKQNYCKNTQTSDAIISNKNLQNIANKLINANMGEDKKKANVVYATAADKNANFPVSGQSWASKLTEADVKNATITEKNGVYNVKIALVEDKTPNIKKGQGHAGKAFSIVTKDQIVKGAGTLGMSVIEEDSIKLTYKNCVINATIDAKTGKLKTIHYFQDWTLSLVALKIAVTVSFGIDEDYVINW